MYSLIEDTEIKFMSSRKNEVLDYMCQSLTGNNNYGTITNSSYIRYNPKHDFIKIVSGYCSLITEQKIKINIIVDRYKQGVKDYHNYLINNKPNQINKYCYRDYAGRLRPKQLGLKAKNIEYWFYNFGHIQAIDANRFNNSQNKSNRRFFLYFS